MLNFEDKLENKPVNNFANKKILSNLIGQKLVNYLVQNIDAKNIQFEDCDFSFSVFNDCYFRGAKFKNCKFIGSQFNNCNMKTAEFTDCKFDYARFNRTWISHDQVLNNLPDFPNTRRDLMREHRVNSVSVGDSDSVKVYIIEELEGERLHWEMAKQGKTPYYKGHYSGFKKQLNVYWKSFLLNSDWFLWGHGESPKKLVTSALCFLSFILLWDVWTKGLQEYLCENPIQFVAGRVYEILLGFLGNLSATSNLNGAQSIVLLLGHYVYLGLFINIIYKKIDKR